MTEENICLLDLQGNLIEGYINPVAREIVGMHSVVYQHREEVGSVLHTHSPAATAFAIANRRYRWRMRRRCGSWGRFRCRWLGMGRGVQ